jgi:cellulose synthase/poly-beta-1,6-N-acetylglucosamine synthase-like glycosyltransferase
MHESVAWLVLSLTGAVLLLLLPLASHRMLLLLLSRRGGPPVARRWEGPLPTVTVQIPLFNEIHVAGRVVDAACRLEHPAELLEIQVLDDSTDGTSSVVAERVAHWRRQGVAIRHLRREGREGFKAGALAAGAAAAGGEFHLILDADFVPSPGLVRRLPAPFTDPSVGMVQARWDHLNEGRGLLTRAQALLLDAHFAFEHRGRWASGRFFNFNGTAGMWRRRCLEESGGWESDTLTEDLDLSYRAQMRGWSFVYLDSLGVPAELPERLGAFEVQQKRWAQGGVQTARKILPGLLKGAFPLGVKSEAVFHLCGHVAHPLTVLLGLLLLPSAVAREVLGLRGLLTLDLLLFGMATLPFLVFYAAAARTRRRPWREVVPGVLATLATGVGLSAVVSRAVVRGVRGREDPFVRTPKAGGERVTAYPGGGGAGDTILKLGLGSYALASALVALHLGYLGSLPFLLLFTAGWLGSGVRGVVEGWAERSVGGSGSPERIGAEQSHHRTPDEETQGIGVDPDPGALVGA